MSPGWHESASQIPSSVGLLRGETLENTGRLRCIDALGPPRPSSPSFFATVKSEEGGHFVSCGEAKMVCSTSLKCSLTNGGVTRPSARSVRQVRATGGDLGGLVDPSTKSNQLHMEV